MLRTTVSYLDCNYFPRIFKHQPILVLVFQGSTGSVSFEEERSVMLEEQTADLTLTAAGAIPKDNDDVTGGCVHFLQPFRCHGFRFVYINLLES